MFAICPGLGSSGHRACSTSVASDEGTETRAVDKGLNNDRTARAAGTGGGRTPRPRVRVAAGLPVRGCSVTDDVSAGRLAKYSTTHI